MNFFIMIMIFFIGFFIGIFFSSLVQVNRNDEYFEMCRRYSEMENLLYSEKTQKHPNNL